MQSKTVETFLSEQYDEIVIMSSKICRGHPDHRDVAHYCIADFIEHVRADELVEQGRAMNFLSGMIHRSFRSSTSPYHKLYRQSGRVHAKSEIVTNETHEEYDHHIDFMTEAVLGILEEMKLMDDKNKDVWYMAVLFELWLENPNYSDIARNTNIPRTSISQAVQQCKDYIIQELKNRNIEL